MTTPGDAIVQLVTQLEAAPLRRGPVEARYWKTRRVLWLEAACGLSRLGDSRAEPLAERGLAALRGGDEVEACVAELYQARLHGPATTADVLGAWAGRLGRDAWYGVCRLVDQSRLLSPTHGVDAFTTFTAAERAGRRPLVWYRRDRAEPPPEPAVSPNARALVLRRACRQLVALAAQGTPAVLAGGELFAAQWAVTTDDASCNARWCLSRVNLFDAYVFALVESASRASSRA